MTVSLTCNNCHVVISAADEDELVPLVQEHVQAHAREHGRSHEVSRADVLARLERQTTKPSP